MGTGSDHPHNNLWHHSSRGPPRHRDDDGDDDECRKRLCDDDDNDEDRDVGVPRWIWRGAGACLGVPRWSLQRSSCFCLIIRIAHNTEPCVDLFGRF